MQFYADTSSVYKADNTYYTNGPRPQWPSDTGGAGPSMGPFVSSGVPWHNPPDMSSGIYSVPHGQPHEALGFGKGTFTYEELAEATDNFSQTNLLGQGGFGYVHKGVLPSGTVVAVKQLKSGSGQGEREFQAEVDIISQVHHRHLVSLVGYCIAGAQRMLIYEFVPNKTLEFHLHGLQATPCSSSFLILLRCKNSVSWLALGSAKGLAYLHEDCHPRIIHRDIKSANILLDNNFEAMVADFGLAKLTSDNNTHVSTRVMGTSGYLAPEYASSGKLTAKSDVFSYGVMLLELLTGRRPIDVSNSYMEDSLVDWARPVLSCALADGNYDDVVDPRLDGNYEPLEMARMVASAAAKKRPKMSQIVRALEGDMSLEDLNEGVRPGQSMMYGAYEKEAPPAGSYTSNMNRIRQVAMASPEYGGTTGEFGQILPIGDSDEYDEEMMSPVGMQPPRRGSFEEMVSPVGMQPTRRGSLEKMVSPVGMQPTHRGYAGKSSD